MNKNYIFNILSWLFQILVWFFLAGIIRNYSLDASNASKLAFLILFLIFYVVYLIFEFLSKEAKFLRTKKSDKDIFQKMGTYYKTFPAFEITCECFHYESATAQPGSYHKRVSYKEVFKFPYYSERDVSGLLILDCDSENIKDKYYVQLELIEELNFADSISYMDYEEAKKKFIEKNKNKDNSFNYFETKYIPGLEKENLIRITDKEPCSANFKCFVFFTIILLGEFYKLFFNHLCILQTYKIRKIISTRYDLNQPEYQELVPKIDIITKKYNYESEYYNYINNEFLLNKPTEEELTRAKSLKFNAPKYKISSTGVVIGESVVFKKAQTEKEAEKKDDKNETGTPAEDVENSDIVFNNNKNNKKNENEIISISNNRRSNQLKNVKVYSERKQINENESQ